ncbi:hypothetical protein PC111_g16755 [Phytophthora cactorum]|nr:hypothetical protein PC111_g16755 [Phytophthora cactorum]KAG3067430.1 hypothetical protein PC122_g17356 [Phytophthora cactorum]
MRLGVIWLATTATILASGNAFPAAVQSKGHPVEPPESSSRLRTEDDNYNLEEYSENTGRGNSDNDYGIDGKRGSSPGADGLTEEERGFFSWLFLRAKSFKSLERTEPLERVKNARAGKATTATILASGNAFPAVKSKGHAIEPPESSSRLRTKDGRNDNGIDGKTGSSRATDGLTEEERGLISWMLFLQWKPFKSLERTPSMEKLRKNRVIRPIRFEDLGNGKMMVVRDKFNVKNAGAAKDKAA